eukprot:53894-Chlamydomonas_euryale.AAC.6
MPACLPACLPVCLSCLPSCLPVCLPVLPACLFACLPVLPACLPVYVLACRLACPVWLPALVRHITRRSRFLPSHSLPPSVQELPAGPPDPPRGAAPGGGRRPQSAVEHGLPREQGPGEVG